MQPTKFMVILEKLLGLATRNAFDDWQKMELNGLQKVSELF